jgi:hypothetical protein
MPRGSSLWSNIIGHLAGIVMQRALVVKPKPDAPLVHWTDAIDRSSLKEILEKKTSGDTRRQTFGEGQRTWAALTLYPHCFRLACQALKPNVDSEAWRRRTLKQGFRSL